MGIGTTELRSSLLHSLDRVNFSFILITFLRSNCFKLTIYFFISLLCTYFEISKIHLFRILKKISIYISTNPFIQFRFSIFNFMGLCLAIWFPAYWFIGLKYVTQTKNGTTANQLLPCKNEIYWF